MSPRTLLRIGPLAGIASVLPILVALAGCGNDDNGNVAAAEQSSCNGSCSAAVTMCPTSASLVSACSTLCQIGYDISPACAGQYAAYLQCAEASPVVQCTSSSVTVTVEVPPCLNQLGDYITCAAGHIAACLDLPLADGACTDAKLGTTAKACVGTTAGCSLLDGTAQAGGFGIFCCGGAPPPS